MRIALRIRQPQAWMGGVNYLLNMYRILRAHAPDIDPVLFTPDGLEAELDKLIVAATCGQQESIAERSRLEDNLAMLGFKDRKSAAAFSQHDIDLVFESGGYYGPKPAFPVLSWLPDFQHRRLPRLFNRRQWWLREARFRRILETRSHILLSSESALNDLTHYYGHPRGAVHVVPFAVRLERNISWEEQEQVRWKYGLPEHYLFLPNQFWAHKNHRLVIEALGLLGGNAPTVVATGNPNDPRSPELFDTLMMRATTLGIADRFRVLGQVPYPDLLALNARAERLINPSLFEGWSTTVEEAKALGTPLLLSDIDVHREQAPDGTIFFRPDDQQDCARALGKAIDTRRQIGPRPAKAARAAWQAEAVFAEHLSRVFRLIVQTL